MQTVSFLNIISPFFQSIMCSDSQVFWSHLQRKFSVVTRAIHAKCPSFHHNWQVFIQARLLLMVQTCDNLMDLGLHCTGGCEKSSNFSCLIASTLTAMKWEHTLFWNKRTPLDSKPPHLFKISSWPQIMDHSSLFYNRAIWKHCQHT